MDFPLRETGIKRFDQLSLGEVNLRFDPEDYRIRTARYFHVNECGGEYNVARALHKGFGLSTAVVTALPENEIGMLAKDLLEQGGVDISHVIWRPYDGIGRNCRLSFSFTERGYGIRGAMSCSDRANSAASHISPGEVDWDAIFGKEGVRWLHTGGIFAALSPDTAQAQLEALRKAQEYGVTVSYDLNFRASLWRANGGLEKAREINREAARYVDVMIGNEEDFTNCLGYAIEGNDDHFLKLNYDGYGKMVEKVMQDYPNLRLVATTLRTAKTATRIDWRAICFTDGKMYRSMEFNDLEIFDRVGGGDGFASGLIYGLLQGFDVQTALNYGAAHGALVQTTPGDTSMANTEEVARVVRGQGTRVIR